MRARERKGDREAERRERERERGGEREKRGGVGQVRREERH